MTRPRRRRAEPALVANLVRDVLGGLMGKAKLRETEALVAWSDVVGPSIAQRTKAERLSKNTLFVCVASSAYANELAMCKREILAKLCNHVGGEPISDLRFRVGSF